MKKPRASDAATFAARRRTPMPDLKGAVKQALTHAAIGLESLEIRDIYGFQDNPAHVKVYDEALSIAINYIKMGTR